ncbi:MULTISPECIES: hypothetical protein [unclassified Lysinibacillus]|uniref:hypothetical protein n=1 Tax=unclassified Lysinibacillus TaxID=2636778 RepID=UPI0030F7EA1E
MPVPNFSPVIGTNSEEILDSLEKQRKELQWLLQSLDTTNVKELNAEVINAGRISAKHLRVGSDTEFEEGYDTRALFEVTNDRITASVEAINGEIATLTIESNQIKTSVVDLENNLSSKITQTANSIRSEVEAEVTTINGNIATTNYNVSMVNQKADEIKATVSSQSTSISNLGTRVTSAESTISQQSWQISQKVSQTDYNGNTIASLINQTATSVKIQAQNIDLYGAVMINGSIEGSTDIRVNRDAYIGNNLYLGTSGWGGKSVNFGGGNGIYYNGEQMTFSAPYLNFDSVNSTLNGYNTIYGTLNVPSTTNLSGLVRAESSGIGISVSGGYLYVKVYGSTVGSVKLT